VLTAALVPRTQKPLAELGANLEAATLRALAAAYYDLNVTFFAGRLRRPSLELASTTNRLGRWIRFPRTLELSRILLVEHGWGTVIEVLKHEMAHQFVDEVLQRADEAAHGPAFREVCAARGIDPRAAGLPSQAPNPADARMLERVAKLLALAESPNEHEAHAAALAAQKLMLKYNIDLVTAGRPRGYAFRHLGTPTGRVSEAARILATLLGDHFFVEAIWIPVWRPLEGKRGTVLEVCGTPENLELAAYTYSFLNHTADRLWKHHQRELGTRRNTGRRQFIAGVMAGFRDKLNQQQELHHQTGLVYVGDPALGGYLRQRHPHVRWTRHHGSQHTREYAAGRAAGRRIVLHRGVSHGPSREPALLPGTRGQTGG
jgi:hypothetical protein